MGFVLPRSDIWTVMGKEGIQTTVDIGKAGVYMSPGGTDDSVLDEASVSVLSRNSPSVTKAKKHSEEKGLAAGLQQQFFITQNAVRDRMLEAAKRMSKWEDDQWLLLLAPASDDFQWTTDWVLDPALSNRSPGGRRRRPSRSPAATSTPGKSPPSFTRQSTGGSFDSSALSARESAENLIRPTAVMCAITTSLVGKSDASQFDYEAPINRKSIELYKCVLNATEGQLAALMSLSTHAASYKLWASYGIMRQLLEVGDSPPPSLRWKAAIKAVAYCTKNQSAVTVSVGAAMTKVISDARAYKRAYQEFLASARLGASPTVVAWKRAREKMRGQVLESRLQKLEDVLPVPTAAWSRFAVSAGKGGKGVVDDGAEGADHELMMISEQDKVLADDRLVKAGR